MDAFTEAFEAIVDDWTKVHEDFAELNKDSSKLEIAKMRDDLEAMAESLEEVVDATEALPSLTGFSKVVKALAKAAQTDLDAVTETAEAAAEAAAAAATAEEATATEATAEAEATETETAAETEAETTAEAPDLSDIEDSIEASTSAIEDVTKAIEDIPEVSPEERNKVVTELNTFDSEYIQLKRSWDRFHADYNEWRQDEGGCDRAGVVDSLASFSDRMASLGADARSLPRSGYLLPAYRLMVQAVDGEGAAMRSLRDTWRPFALDSFRAVDRARFDSDRLRGEVDIAVLELQGRF